MLCGNGDANRVIAGQRLRLSLLPESWSSCRVARVPSVSGMSPAGIWHLKWVINAHKSMRRIILPLCPYSEINGTGTRPWPQRNQRRSARLKRRNSTTAHPLSSHPGRSLGAELFSLPVLCYGKMLASPQPFRLDSLGTVYNLVYPSQH